MAVEGMEVEMATTTDLEMVCDCPFRVAFFFCFICKGIWLGLKESGTVNKYLTQVDMVEAVLATEAVVEDMVVEEDQATVTMVVEATVVADMEAEEDTVVVVAATTIIITTAVETLEAVSLCLQCPLLEPISSRFLDCEFSLVHR